MEYPHFEKWHEKWVINMDYADPKWGAHPSSIRMILDSSACILQWILVQWQHRSSFFDHRVTIGLFFGGCINQVDELG